MSALLLGATLSARLAPFVQAGALDLTDQHVVDTLGHLGGERRPDVLLALALAVHAPRLGPVCIHPRTVTRADVLSSDDPLPAALPWPADRQAWLAQIGESPLVGPPGASTPFILDDERLYTARYHRYETRLGEALRVRLTQAHPPHDPTLLTRGLRALFQPSDELDRQALGAAMACLRGFSVLTGGPGTGKTHTVRAVLTLLWAQARVAHPERPLRVALAAPTGKAAARMREALLAGLQPFLRSAADALPPETTSDALGDFLAQARPRTLHRLLGFRPSSPTRFRHHRADPLPYDVIIVDEASMIDLALMAKLEDAVAPSARLVLLGDPHQLASVEAGTVLADLCSPVGADKVRLSRGFAAELARDAGLDVAGQAELLPDPSPFDGIVRFHRSRRFHEGSGIGALARACLAGRGSRALDVLDDPRFPDVQRLEHGPTGQLSSAACELVLQGFAPVLAALLAGPRGGETHAELHLRALHALDEVRLLAAHRQGPLGVEGLNQTAIGLLQRRFHHLDTRQTHWLGRPILILRNDAASGLFNGDVGLTVLSPDGRLTVAFPTDGGLRYVAPARLPEHQTVFAMTIHKSQGSEVRHAVLVLPKQRSPLLTRELVYTGVTRARERVTVLGSAGVLTAAIASEVRRASGLGAGVWGE